MAFAARMFALTEQLSKRLMDGGSIERRDLSTQLLNLSKFIDHAVASNQKPTNAPLIYRCFKQAGLLIALRMLVITLPFPSHLVQNEQFTYFKYDEMLRPSVMVLMLSIKSACLAGWFSNSEVEELLQTYKFLSQHFLLDGECAKPHSLLGEPVSNEIKNVESFIAMICTRFYPRLAVTSALVALTAKPGYDSLGIDFQVTSQLAMFTKLRLFVCQKDDTGTSACLVTPPLLSFLVNGKGVEKRVYVPPTPELGPQLPSDITPMLRIGCNFLQIIGENTANYFVAVAIMSSVPWSSSSLQLEDYVSPPPVAETDDEVIVGRTRVSLRCPISLKRISTPIKGVSCRHHQAFDYDSYIEINDRRPSWRCPCCNTYVNCSELRLDRQMEQILKEVDQSLFDVMINHDGSWAPDVPADESDVVHIQRDGQTMGDDLAERLEESVIIISDDEEGEQVGTLVSPRESYVPQVSTVSTTSVPLVDVVDRKPNIRTTVVNEAVGSAPTHTPVLASSRESPVLNAIYSEIPQGGTTTAASVRSIQASQGGYISTTQSAVRNPSSWVPATGFWSTSGQPSDSRSVVMERQLHTQPSRTPVIQALPAQTQYSNPSGGRLNLTGQVSALPTMPPLQVPSASQVPSQVPSLLPTTLAYEVHALQQQLTQQQQHRNADALDMIMLQELRQLQQQQLQQQQQQQQQQLQQQQLQQQQQQQQQLQQQQQQQQQLQQQQQQLQQQQLQQQQAYNQSQRNQRHGQRSSQQQLRDARSHQFTGASSHQAVQGQQSSNQLGQQMQYPVNSNLQSSLPVQDYYHRHRLSQQLQQAVQTSSSSRGSPFPVANGGSPSGHGAGTGGSQRDLASQTSSHSMYSGRTNSVSNISAAGTNNSYPGVEGWVPPPQLTNWRPPGTPRMRGAIGGGSTAGMSSGLRGTNLSSVTQAGQVNIRTRVSSNAVNTVPATPLQATGPGTSLWAGRPPFNAAGNSEIFMAPEPASTSTMLEDISWPSTLLDNSSMENIGHIDPGSWIDDSLFNPMSPPSQ